MRASRMRSNRITASTSSALPLAPPSAAALAASARSKAPSSATASASLPLPPHVSANETRITTQGKQQEKKNVHNASITGPSWRDNRATRSFPTWPLDATTKNTPLSCVPVACSGHSHRTSQSRLKRLHSDRCACLSGSGLALLRATQAHLTLGPQCLILRVERGQQQLFSPCIWYLVFGIWYLHARRARS